jgi:hypothetical protein
MTIRAALGTHPSVDLLTRRRGSCSYLRLYLRHLVLGDRTALANPAGRLIVKGACPLVDNST